MDDGTNPRDTSGLLVGGGGKVISGTKNGIRPPWLHFLRGRGLVRVGVEKGVLGGGEIS